MSSEIKMKTFEVSSIEFDDEFRAVAEEALAGMKSLIPKDTGNTRDALEYELYPDGGYYISARAPNYRILHLIEFGTVHMAAQPFMRPVAEMMKQKNTEAITRALNKAVKLK